VLGCVLLVVGDGKAVVRATNLDVSVELNLKAKVLESGVVAVSAHIFSQTISTLTNQKLTLHTSQNNLIIDGDRGKTSITTLDASEFPTLPYVKNNKGTPLTISTRDLIATLKSVAFAASTSSVKPELASISVSLEGGEMVAAATDSFRLAEVKIPVKTKNSFDSVLLPARNTPDILRMLESSEDVEIRVGDNQCTFVTDLGYLTSRTIDGAFPDYHAIIPKDVVASATCLKEEAIQAFKKISIFTDAFNQVHLSFKPSEKTFTVSALNAAVGETIDAIPATVEGEDIDINFNARYIVDALSVVGGDSVSFLVAGQGKPMLMTDVPRKGFTYLVMPMNR
jgi:DNA polymerase III subunit beta